MVHIQSAAAEIRRGKKRRTNHSMKTYMVSLLHTATIKKLNPGSGLETEWAYSSRKGRDGKVKK